MNLILSLDYELFFGSWHGSPQHAEIKLAGYSQYDPVMTHEYLA